MARLAATRDGLREFGAASDDEFTALARGLARLNPRLAEVRERATALDRVLQDQDDERPIASAYALYKNSVDLVHANAGIAVSAQAQLGAIEQALTSACRSREAFRRDLLFLRIVTLGIRIEASRLPAESQSVFLNVAADIAETGERISGCTESAFNQLEAVIGSSASARAELQASEASLHRDARERIEAIQRELQALQQALTPAAACSQRIAARFVAAQPQTLAIISALQHQDIVRQQLEHVGEGFADLEQHLHASDGGGATIEWDYVRQAMRIQQTQLTGARTEIERAGDIVVRGLGQLLETVTGMVEEFGAMEQAAGQALDRCNVVEMFQREIEQLTAIVERSRKANERTAQLVDQIAGVVRVFSEEISRYELEVKIVALNAQVAAARLTSADALNKLAEQTSRLADTNGSLTHQLSSELHASLAQLEQVKREGASFITVVSQERNALQSNVGPVSQKLAGLVRRVRTGSSETRRAFAPVQADCAALLGNLRFPGMIASSFAPAATLCDELAALAGAPSGGRTSAAAQTRIHRHQQRYTMRKEEEAHAAALRASHPTQPPTVLPAPAGPPGGDIELFDTEPAALPRAAANGTASTGDLPATNGTRQPGEFGDGIDLF